MPSFNVDELKQKIHDLLKLSKEVTDSIKNINLTSELSSIREQLKGVSKIISDLENKRVPVPTELRNLKSSLVNQLSELEELNKLVADFYGEIRQLNGFKAQPQNSNTTKPNLQKQFKSSGPRIRNTHLTSILLKNLIEDGILQPNTKLIRHGRSATYSGFINSSGQIVININGTNKYFDSPSGAAESLVGGGINGWDWWSVQKDGKEIKLSVFRERYHNKYK